MRRIIAVIIYTILLAGCSKENKEIKYEIIKAGHYGDSSNVNNGQIYEIGFIGINSKQQVYIIDRALRTVKMFAKEGKYLRTYGKGMGSGPGELLSPDGIAVDDEGGVYITDSQKMRLTYYDSLGSVAKTIKLSFIAANIAATKPGIIYITGMPFSYKGDLVYKYNLNNTDYNRPVLIFCERIDPGDNKALATNGARIGLEKSIEGNIIYNFPYPYEFRIYNENGILLDKYQRAPNDFKPPFYKKINGLTVNICDNMILDPIILNDSIYAYRVLQNERSKQYLDFYNVKTKKYIGAINSKDIGVDNSAQIKGDRRGNIYHVVSQPYPHVEKIKLKIIQ